MRSCFVWIKLCLPRLLKLINLIPWKLRYSLTTLCALLMLVNGIMTLQALDCWYERLSGTAGDTPVEEFYARNFDNDYMQHRFQSMEITPEDSGRAGHRCLARESDLGSCAATLWQEKPGRRSCRRAFCMRETKVEKSLVLDSTYHLSAKKAALAAGMLRMPAASVAGSPSV